METLALNAGWHAWAMTRKTDAICFRNAFDLPFFLQNERVSEKKVKVFPKRNFFFKTKTFSFINHFQSESVFETKVKFFLKRKRFHL